MIKELSKEQLQLKIENLILFHNLSLEEKEGTGWIENLIASQKTVGQINEDFIKILVEWYYYLNKYQQTEDYEFCNTINEAIHIEQKEYQELLSHLFPGLHHPFI